MNCDAEVLVAYVLGELEASQREAVESHLRACRACADRVAELRATLDLAATLPQAQARPVSMRRLRAAIARENAGAEESKTPAAQVVPVRPVARRWRWASALAAAAALAILCFHYGIAVRVGQFEIALGGPRGVTAGSAIGPGSEKTMNEQTIRTAMREEIATQVGPSLAQLADSIADLDDRQQESLVGLHNAILAQRVTDLNEVNRNMGVLASTVDYTLGAR